MTVAIKHGDRLATPQLYLRASGKTFRCYWSPPENACPSTLQRRFPKPTTLPETQSRSTREITEGYPYFIQEWAYEVWNSAVRSQFSAETVEHVGPIVQDKLDKSFFSVRLDRLTPTERRYLRAMAELGPGPHRSGDIAGQYGATVESVAPTRSALIKKGMVYSPAHGDTAFTVPLFDEFMRRVVPAEPKRTGKRRA